MALLRNSKVEANGDLIKSVALCPTNMKPRMVLKAVRSGPADEHCTQQEVNKGDVVIMGTTSNGKTKVDILHVDNVTRYKTFMSKITAGTVDMSANGGHLNWLGLFETADERLRNWLTNADTDFLLPTGFGWDGKRTRYEQAKMKEFSDLLGGVTDPLRDDLIEWAMVSPRENVNHEWNTSQPIPRDPVNLAPGSNVLSHFTILWTDYGVDFMSYEDKDYTEEYLSVTSLQNDAVNKALVGTIITNKYGKNVRWKLYS
jgi:hypothetical protein